jgi:hypothetical protein
MVLTLHGQVVLHLGVFSMLLDYAGVLGNFQIVSNSQIPVFFSWNNTEQDWTPPSLFFSEL